MEQFEHVEIAADGFYQYVYKNKRFIRKKVKKAAACSQLRSICVIAPGVTLGDIFNIIEKHKLIKAFIAQYSWCKTIDQFHAQAKEPIRSKDDPGEELKLLEINWDVYIADTFTEKIKHKSGLRERIKATDFELFPNFIGRGENKSFSVSYTPMYDLAHLPVILNESFVVEEKLTMQNICNQETVFSSTRQFTLLNILDAIYFDISFIGSPAETKDFIEEMKNRSEIIKQQRNEKSI